MMIEVTYGTKLQLAKNFVRDRILSIREAESKFQVDLGELERIDEAYPLLVNGFYEFTDRPAPNYVMFAKYFINEIGYVSANGYDYIFNGTHYDCVHPNIIKNKIIQLTQERAKPHEVDSFYKQLSYMGVKSEKEMNQMKDLCDGRVNLLNGVYDIKTSNLWCHHKDYFFQSVLPYSFDKDAKCPRFDAFLENAFKQNYGLVTAFYQMLGYLIQGGYPYLQQAFILLGKPYSGKTTALTLIDNFLGSKNCQWMAFNQFEDKFIPHLLNGKFASIIDEVPPDGIDSELFKKIVTGKKITAQDKGKPAYSMDCNFRIIVASNSLLKFRETDDLESLSRRQFYFPFDNPIDKSKVNADIDRVFMAELPGIFNRAIVGLGELMVSKKMPYLVESQALLESFEKSQDSVVDFVNEECEFDALAQNIKQNEFYASYKLWCHYTSRKPFGRNKFYERLIKEMKKMLIKNETSSVNLEARVGNSRIINYFKQRDTEFKEYKNSKGKNVFFEEF